MQQLGMNYIESCTINCIHLQCIENYVTPSTAGGRSVLIIIVHEQMFTSIVLHIRRCYTFGYQTIRVSNISQTANELSTPLILGGVLGESLV